MIMTLTNRLKQNMRTIAAAAAAAALLFSSIPIPSVHAADAHDTKLIALTFDDGPNTTTTNAVLDLLEEYNAKASFFLIGTNINAESAVTVKRAYDMGMEIDNHSKTHSNMSKMPAEECKAEIEYVDEKVEEIIGEKTKFFRPPFIDVSAEMYDAIDLPFICGIDCQDYKAEVTAQERADYILNGAKDGVIVLLHDAAGNQQTVEALEIAMPQLVEQGYEFVTLTELFERQGETPKHGIIYSNVGKYPAGYEVKETISAGDIDRILLDMKMLEELGDTYAIEMDYTSATGYPPVIALQKWSGTPTIWHPVQPAYFNGDKAVFLAEDVLDALEQLELGYSDLDGMQLIAYSGEIVLSDVKLLTKSEEPGTKTDLTGDVNDDGEFTVADVILLQKWLSAVPDTHLANWKAGNLYEDNQLDVFDLCLMKRALLHKKGVDEEKGIIPGIRNGMTKKQVFDILGTDYTDEEDRTWKYSYDYPVKAGEVFGTNLAGIMFVEFDSKTNQLVNYGYALGRTGTAEERLYPYSEDELKEAYSIIYNQMVEWYGEAAQGTNTSPKAEYAWETDDGQVWAMYGINLWADAPPASYEKGVNELVLSCSVEGR